MTSDIEKQVKEAYQKFIDNFLAIYPRDFDNIIKKNKELALSKLRKIFQQVEKIKKIEKRTEAMKKTFDLQMALIATTTFFYEKELELEALGKNPKEAIFWKEFYGFVSEWICEDSKFKQFLRMSTSFMTASKLL